MGDVATNNWSKLRKRAYITKKIRMMSEAKFIFWHHFSHIILTYYSIFVVGMNIFKDKYSGQFNNYDELSLLLSVVILIAAVCVYGWDFSLKAHNYKECYLKIQKLEVESLNDKNFGVNTENC